MTTLVADEPGNDLPERRVASGLVKHTRILAGLCRDAHCGEQRVLMTASHQAALITATYFTAAAAIEAILSEAAHRHAPDLYTDAFRAARAPEKFEMLLGEAAPAMVECIGMVHSASIHSESDNARNGTRGIHLTVAGASDAARYVEHLAVRIAGRYALTSARQEIQTLSAGNFPPR